MNFGKWRDAVAVLESDALIVGDPHSHDRSVLSDKTDIPYGAFWVKAFSTHHVNSSLLEMLAGLESNQIMPISEPVPSTAIGVPICA